MTPDLMTILEVAEETRMPTKAIWWHINQGHLPVIRLSERRALIKRAELNNFLSKFSGKYAIKSETGGTEE